jgi:hypothetical protein
MPLNPAPSARWTSWPPKRSPCAAVGPHCEHPYRPAVGWNRVMPATCKGRPDMASATSRSAPMPPNRLVAWNLASGLDQRARVARRVTTWSSNKYGRIATSPEPCLRERPKPGGGVGEPRSRYRLAQRHGDHLRSMASIPGVGSAGRLRPPRTRRPPVAARPGRGLGPDDRFPRSYATVGGFFLRRLNHGGERRANMRRGGQRRWFPSRGRELP